MTDAEVFLWSKLRRKQLYGVIFSRQKTIGNYIVDFYCKAAQLVIEIEQRSTLPGRSSASRCKARYLFEGYGIDGAQIFESRRAEMH